MSLRHFLSALILVPLLIVGCGDRQKVIPPPKFEMTKAEKPAGGITWSYPSTWLLQHELPMRVATYVIPSGVEDIEPGECGVFYFGKNQGGDVKSNIERWGSQFEGAKQAEETDKKIGGMDVAFVKIAGTYLAPGGPDMKSQGKKDNYKLLGAIVSAPDGMVFFKCTGPAKVIDKSVEEFTAMLDSIEKQ
jgi:hypothetical protein